MENYYEIFKTEIEIVDAELKRMQSELRNADNPADSLDLASEIEQRNFTQMNIQRLARKKLQLESAAKKALAGDFGYCEDCGVDIPRKRLILQPEATFCVECQSAFELKMKHVRTG